jgi:hypothetical protein
MELKKLNVRITELGLKIKANYGSPSLRWIAPILIAGFLAWHWDHTSTPSGEDALKRSDIEAADTFIPAGFVLVPIEVANYEALDSILGKFGVVDLFIPTSESGQRPQKIAERLKILRAPLNPSRFAVLVPEAESSQIVTHSGPFAVSIQNPNSVGTNFVRPANGSHLSQSAIDQNDTSASEPGARSQTHRRSRAQYGHRHSHSNRIEMETFDVP